MHRELETVVVAFDEEAGVGELTMNRPDALNAMNETLRSECVEGLELLEERNREGEGVALRAVVLSGAGEKAFSAGADVKEFSERRPGETSDRPLGRFIREFPVPVVAKIQGYCLGGGLETALACDVRFASTDSTFGLPEVDLGIIPGAGGFQYVANVAGTAVATELVMAAERFSAERAADLGLVNRVHEPGELDDAVQAFAEDLASKAPLAIQATKQSARMAVQAGLEEAIAHDRAQAARLLDTEDAEEGAAAFAEDREPEFQGR